MTAGRMSGGAALERRYRRLLAWYPAAHRGTYGEEMIGVLLASTPPGQDRPSKADVLDLIGGGLRTRLRQLRTGGGNPAWPDALAVFSVVAPVALLGWLTAGYLTTIEFQMGRGILSQRAARADSALLTALIATAIAVLALAACPALARRGRAVAASALAVIGAAAAVIGLVQAYRVFSGLGRGQDNPIPLYLTLTAAMVVLALVASPGPARGWRLLSRRGVVVLAVISVVVIAASTASATQSYPWGNVVNTILDLSGIVTVFGVALTLRWPVGSRVMALWAILGYQFIGFAAAQYLFPPYQFSSYTAYVAEFRYLPTAVEAVLVGLAAWWSHRRGQSQAPDTSP